LNSCTKFQNGDISIKTIKKTLRFLCPPTGGFSAVGDSLRLTLMAFGRIGNLMLSFLI